MSKIGLMVSAGRAGAPMSSHFGHAEYILIADTQTGTREFIQNTELNGGGAVRLLVAQGCSDAVFAQIGKGAVTRLEAEKIHGWLAPAGIPGEEALKLFEESRLPAAHTAGNHAGCCCGSHEGATATTNCCGTCH